MKRKIIVPKTVSQHIEEEFRKRSFTLLELIVVIIIIAILASIGFVQYNSIFEKARLVEAMVRVGRMRELAYEYYLNYGSLAGIQNSDVEVNNTCTSTSFYNYSLGYTTSNQTDLAARRCSSGGKAPDTTRAYDFGLRYYPASGNGTWMCAYLDTWEPCFGFPAPLSSFGHSLVDFSGVKLDEKI